MKILPTFPSLPVHLFPIVHPGALELFVVELEAERLKEMQRCPCRGAEARDVAGVGRKLRFNKDDVHESTQCGIRGDETHSSDFTRAATTPSAFLPRLLLLPAL